MDSVMVRERILLVDDEPRILAGYQRHLRRRFLVEAAPDGETALAMIKEQEPFAVVVTDLRMPGMDGIRLLEKVKKLSPDTIRIMLTGYADVKSAMAAVNDGNIFRLLTKPCDSQTLIRSLVEAVKQHRLVISERQLLEETLSSSLMVFTDLLSVVKPDAFGRSARVASWASKLAQFMDVDEPWEVSVAASLCQVGLIILPDAVVRRLNTGRTLSPDQAALFTKHPRTTAELIEKIPRLERVAHIIAYQEKHYDGTGIPTDEVRGTDIPLGARILKVSLDFDSLIASGLYKGEAYRKMKHHPGFYDPDVYKALGGLLGVEKKYTLLELEIYKLKPHMILAEDVYSERPRRLIVSKGQELSEQVILYLRKYRRTVGVVQPIKVICPIWVK